MFKTGATSYDPTTGKSFDLIMNEKDFESVANILKQNIFSRQETIKELHTKIEEMQADTYKDSELRQLQQKYNEMQKDYCRGFPISQAEADSIAVWKKKHDTEEHNNSENYHGAAGGGYFYQFYPTGIGTVGSCYCETCHNKMFGKDEYTQYMTEHNAVFIFSDID